MLACKLVARHFVFMVWNDLLLNRNGAGFVGNLRLIREDIIFAIR